MENISINSKYNALPDNLKRQVSDFIDFLLEKKQKTSKKNRTKTPKFGSCKGMFEMSPDFDEPLEDFKDYMY
jgi:hypothetical protein